MTAIAPETTPKTFDDAQAVLAARLPGYQRRPHQMALAEQVELAIANGQPGLFQAGTGTGKSLALTIPAILSGKRVVIATSTKALQDQYANTDLPFLGEHLGVPFTWAVLKGRSNYPCHEKAKGVTSPTPAQRVVLERMEQLSTREAILDGMLIDRESFAQLTEEEWLPFSMSASECPGAKSCPFAGPCFAERAKAKAAESQVVITNTAYLLLDLSLRLQTEGKVAMLGDFDLLIVDEAHELPDAATRALEDTIGQGTFVKLARDMAAYLHREDGHPGAAEEIEVAVQQLWDVLQRRYDEFARKAPGKTDPMPLTVTAIIEELGEHFRGLFHAIRAAREEIKATPAGDERGAVQRKRLMNRSANWLDRILAYTTDEPDKTLRWAETETKPVRGRVQTRLYLRSAPISVAPFLRLAMWDRVQTLLSSATLAAGRDFSYLIETVGLHPGEAMTYDAGSPFDYPHQTLLFTPAKDVVAPEKQAMAAWRAYAQSVTLHLVERSGGGALLLFTSGTALREAYGALGPQLRRMGLTVLRQGDAPTGELIRQFKADGNAVLFGLKTFMVGIDVQGLALRLVVLDKLPFAVPTDLLYQARCELINSQYRDRWASFTKLTIPMMILTLAQAFGRLIRHTSDKGVVAILDSRLNGKRYGTSILNALPPARRTSDIEAAAAFLEALR